MDQRKALYEYLREKSGKSQDPMNDAYRLSDVGGLLGGLSEAASMAGQIQGKRSQSDIVPNVSKNLYDTSQDAAKADQDLEERQLKRLRLMEELSPESRVKKEKYRFEPELRSPQGDPVMLSESGDFQNLPGFKVQQRPVQMGAGQIIQGYEKPGYILERRPDGSLVERELPKGFEPKEKPEKDLNSSDKTRLDNLNMALTTAVEFDQFFKQNPPSAAEIGGIPVGRMYDTAKNALTFGDTRYDELARRWKEAVGRMQSGGAITGGEIQEFIAMAPTLKDSPERVQSKLEWMKKELSSRMKTLQGARPDPEAILRGGQGQGGKIRVRNKQTGQTGRISPQYLDPQKYEVINE